MKNPSRNILHLKILGLAFYEHAEQFLFATIWQRFVREVTRNVVNKYNDDDESKEGNQLCVEKRYPHYYIINLKKLFDLSKDRRLEYISAKVWQIQIVQELVELYKQDTIKLVQYGCVFIDDDDDNNIDSHYCNIPLSTTGSNTSKYIIVYSIVDGLGANKIDYLISSHLPIQYGAQLLNQLCAHDRSPASLKEFLYFKKVQLSPSKNDIIASWGTTLRIQHADNIDEQLSVFWVLEISSLNGTNNQVDLISETSLSFPQKNQVNWNHYADMMKWMQNYSDVVQWMQQNETKITTTMIVDDITKPKNIQKIVNFKVAKYSKD